MVVAVYAAFDRLADHSDGRDIYMVVYQPLEGPALNGDDHGSPFADGWEWSKRMGDGHRHVWEFVDLQAGQARYEPDTVVRCRVCHCPRCGSSDHAFPCQEPRHHRGPHTDGRPVGE